MDRLEAMTILLAAVDTGSLSAASRQLRIPLATVSRRVAELEEHLRIRLLLRGNRKLTLTDVGRDYVVSCRRIMEDIAEAERSAAGEYRTPRGELVISAPTIMGRTHAVPLAVEFLRVHPEIRMRVELNDRMVNLLEEHVDLALRVGELPDSSMIAAHVGLCRPVVCASPAYLKVRGVPKKPKELASHDCIAYKGYHSTLNNWEFHTKGTSHTILVSSRLVVNATDAAVAAATADAGIARVFSFQIADLVREIPIVFTVVSDPIGAGLVTSISRPGGNITGFINIEAATAGKSLGLLKEIAPTIKRAAIMFNPDTAPGGGKYFLSAFEVAARSLGVEPISMEVRSDAEIEAAISGLKDQHAGLVLNSDSFLGVHQATVILSTMRNSVPTIGDIDGMVLEGGLMYYGPDYMDVFHRAAGRVNRILRGERPSALPVEFPTKWTLLINLKTAKTLGLTIPPNLLAIADEVIA